LITGKTYGFGEEYNSDLSDHLNDSFGAKTSNNNISNYQGSTITSVPTYTPSYLESTIVNKLGGRGFDSHRSTDQRLDIVLSVLDLEHLIDLFYKNRLNFNDLLFLTKDDLIELDVSLAARNRILRFAESYKQYGKEYTVEEIFDFFHKYKSFIIKPLHGMSNHEYGVQPIRAYTDTVLPTASFNHLTSDSKKPYLNTYGSGGRHNHGGSEIISPKFNNSSKGGYNDHSLSIPQYFDIGDVNALSDYCSNRQRSESEERASQTVPTSISKRDNPFQVSLFDRFNSHGNNEVEQRKGHNKSSVGGISKTLTNNLNDLKLSDIEPPKSEVTSNKLSRQRKNHKIQKEYVNLTSEIDNYLKNFEKLKEKSDDRQNRLKCLIKKSNKSRSRSKSNSRLGLNPDDLEMEEERNLNEEFGRLMGRINSASKLSLDNQSQMHLNRIKSLADLNRNFKIQDINYINKEIDKLYELINRKNELQTNLSKCNQSILDGKKVSSD
jgi:hypothetical protein